MHGFDASLWREPETALRDGRPILVVIRASEQGPADVDVVRWGRAKRMTEDCWVSVDSQPDSPVMYADGEIYKWMPMPTWAEPAHISQLRTAVQDFGVDGAGI